MGAGFFGIFLGRAKLHHNVGEGALGLNEFWAVAFAFLQGRHDLFPGVAALAGIPVNLPSDAQIFVGLQIKLHVEQVAQGPGGEAQQSLEDDELSGFFVDRPLQSAVVVAVYRAQDGFALGNLFDVLLQDVDVVAARIQRRQTVLGPLHTVIAMVIVGADSSNPVGSQDVGNALGQGGLAGGGVTHNPQNRVLLFHRDVSHCSYPRPRKLFENRCLKFD